MKLEGRYFHFVEITSYSCHCYVMKSIICQCYTCILSHSMKSVKRIERVTVAVAVVMPFISICHVAELAVE